MITLNNFLSAVNYQITTGNFVAGQQQKYFQYSITHLYEQYGISISCCFNANDQSIISITLNDYRNARGYKFDPLVDVNDQPYVQGFLINGKMVSYLHVLDIDIIDKITTIFKDGTYDPRLIVEIEMTTDEYDLISSAAKMENMSIEQFMEYSIEKKMEELMK